MKLTKVASDLIDSIHALLGKDAGGDFLSRLRTVQINYDKDPAKYAGVSPEDVVAKVASDMAAECKKNVKTAEEYLKEATAVVAGMAKIGMDAMGLDTDILDVIEDENLRNEIGQIAGFGHNLKVATDNQIYVEGIQKLAASLQVTPEQAIQYIDSLDDQSAFVLGMRVTMVE